MKAWFEHCLSWEENPKLGLDWYRHHKKHPYEGFTVQFMFFKWMVIFNWVSNYKAYKKIIDRRSWHKKDN